MPLVKSSGLLLVAVGLAAQQYPVLPVAHSPRNIEHILQDRSGRIWVSTHDDILCFDGERFFSLREAGFPPVFGTLAQDDEGGILSATSMGVYRFFKGRLEHFLPGTDVTEVISEAPGILVASVGRSLYRLRRVGNDWRVEPFVKSETGPNLTRDRNDNLLTPCPGGWCEYPAAMVVGGAHPSVPIFHSSPLPITRVFRDRARCLWFRSGEDAGYQCPGDRQPVSLPSSVAGRNTWGAEEETENGDMLFASMASVSLGRPGSFQTLSSDNGLPPEAVTCAIRASDGTIWIGSIGGLYRFPYPFRMAHWNSRFGLFGAFERLKGAMYAGTSAGVARLDNGTWNALASLRGIGSVSSLLAGRDDRLWAAVPGKAVLKLAPNGAIEASTPPGQTGVGEALARGADGSVWLAGDEIYRILQKGRNLALSPQNPAGPSLANGRVASDTQGGLWACLAGSLLRWQAGTWANIAEGLPAARCRSLAFARSGDIWAGYGADLALIRPAATPGTSTVRIYPGGGETGDGVTYTFQADARGWLWRGSQDGIYVADASQAERGLWLHLNESDGLVDLDINRGSLYAEGDGSMWWGAAASVVHFAPPPDLVHPASAAQIFVSAFSVDGAAAKWADFSPELPAAKKLTAYLGSLDFERRNSLRVRYRVLPNDNAWRESSSLTLDLGSLGWGRRTLEVQSRFSAGEWSQPWRRELILLRPWWLSWPAILGLAGVLCSGALGWVGWLRRSRVRARTELPDLSPWRMAFLSRESGLANTTFDQRFRLDEPLARGGFGSVFKGVDLHTGRACAIKVFRRDVLDENWLSHRFEQEVSALEQIQHPSVVSIYGYGASPEGAYLAMEFIEGGTLRELLNAGPFPAGRTASLLSQAAGALESIHARGIYHRDLKPENLMLRAKAAPGEDLVLIDFSIAIVKEPEQTMHGLSRAAGTLYYMAPEQAMGFAMAASDIFRLAKVLIEMLTGRRLTELLPNAKLDLPRRVRELARSLPIRLSEESVELIGSALEFDPSRRPQAAAAFAAPIARDLMSETGNS